MAGLEPLELRRGLWRWVRRHSEWEPVGDDGSPTVWPPDVGCVLYETASAAVLVDPLVAADGDDELWRWLDERCAGRSVTVLETIGYHRRSRDAVTRRYGASRALPPGVSAHPLPLAAETVFFVEEHRALIPGDVLIAPAGTLEMCPESWLENLPGAPKLGELREALAPLLALEVELVLVSHGEPVLAGGRAALAGALAEP